MSYWFTVTVELRQGYVMSLWLFNLYIDRVVREVNVLMCKTKLCYLLFVLLIVGETAKVYVWCSVTQSRLVGTKMELGP